MRGRGIPISVPRRMVLDLLYFAKRIPTVPVQKRMSLAPLVTARAECRQRVRWVAIFTKAYAIVVPSPGDSGATPRLHQNSVADMLYEYPGPAERAHHVVERDYYSEPVLLPVAIKDPAQESLHHITGQIEQARHAPLEQLNHFRRWIWWARLPTPIRRIVWWFGLNVGRQRANLFRDFS